MVVLSSRVAVVSSFFIAMQCCDALNQPHPPSKQSRNLSRRQTLELILAGAGTSIVAAGAPVPAAWGAAAIQDTMDVDNFLRTGVDMGGPMGVSSQAGKSRPETGVYLR